MWYVLSALGIACAVLCVVVLMQRKRLESVKTASRLIAETIDHITELLREAEKGQDFSARYANPHLVPCWKVRECEKSECPAYKNANLRCWQVLAARGAPLFERLEKCEECQAYRCAQPDVVWKLVEVFNNVMALLERNADRLAEAKRHIQQAHKLAAVGEFAAGVAHEINNPLDGILSCVARLERDPANLTQNIEYLKLIHDALKRISSTVQHLLEYSQKRDVQLEPTDIHEVLERVIALISTAARRNAIDVAFEYDESVPFILGDKYYLEQAILNLALNAIAATPAGGEIAFRTRTRNAENGAERLVEVDVADSGAGMAPVIVDRIFDPFFTTKEPGKGTGLGLALVKSIIEDHRGAILVQSALGHGTTMKVRLPVVRADNAANQVNEEVAEP